MNMKLKPTMDEQSLNAERQKVQSCLRYAQSLCVPSYTRCVCTNKVKKGHRLLASIEGPPCLLCLMLVFLVLLHQDPRKHERTRTNTPKARTPRSVAKVT